MNGQNFNECTWFFIFLGGKNDQVCDYIQTHGLCVINSLAGQSGTWKEHDWEIGDKEVQ